MVPLGFSPKYGYSVFMILGLHVWDFLVAAMHPGQAS